MPRRTASCRYQQIPGWNGKCTPGEAFTGSDCNQKLIGARYYNAGWGGNAGIDAQLPWEFNSPRDFGGHGTHTATTAGGNASVPATGAGRRVRQHQRHRAARAHRGLQGLLGNRRRRLVLHDRQRGGHRPGRGRRRRRHQLLDQRLDRRTSATRSRSPSCSPPMRACSSRLRPATAARDQHRGAPRPVADDGGGRHAQPNRRAAR